MKSILLHIHDDRGQDQRLAAALDLARLHGSHIACAQVLRPPMRDPLGGLYASPPLREAHRARLEEQRTRIELRLKSEEVSWDWELMEGHATDILISRGRLADLLVLSRDDRRSGESPEPLPIAADVVMHVRAPALVVPPAMERFRADGPAVVAWNGSIEAAHSLRLALSFLRLSAEVHIVTVANDAVELSSARAGRYLARHGVRSELHEWPRMGRDIAQTLLEAARDLGAGCLVTGAYGHSRLRETVLGGVTRDLLARTSTPLLLTH